MVNNGIGIKLPARMGNTWPNITEPLVVTLTFTSDDPYAIAFHLQSNHDYAHWLVGRDLLHEGMYAIHHPVGAGDVTVRVPRQNSNTLSIMLKPTGVGEATEPLYVLVPRQLVRRFLDATYEAVPMGNEDLHLNIDSVITQLLGEC